MIEVNWTLLSVIIVVIFGLLGIQKGWWKEAITTIALGILVLFLRFPEAALAFIDSINWVLEKIWNILPGGLATTITEFLENTLNLNIPGGIPQLDPANPNTWFAMLLIFVGLAIIISRASLRRELARSRGHFYRPTAIGSILGGLLGALNGFLIINLAREYVDGRALPGGIASTASTGELTLPGTGSFGVASSGVTIQATDMPSITILDSAIPLVVLLFCILLFISALSTRLSRDGLNISAKKLPYGYGKFEVVPKQKDKKDRATVEISRG